MGERKNIDRLFQEKLKNFEQTPDDRIWENIRQELESNKEPEKKILPIWYRLGGIAASFILLLGLIVSFWPDENTQPNTTIVNADENSKKETLVKDAELNQVNNETKNELNSQEVVAFEERENEDAVKQLQENNRDPFSSFDINTQPQTDSYVNSDNSVQQANQLFKNEAKKDRIHLNKKPLNTKQVIAQGSQKNSEGSNKELNIDSRNVVATNTVDQNNSGNTIKESTLSNVEKKDSEKNQLDPLSVSKKESSLAESSIRVTDKKTSKLSEKNVNRAVVTNENSENKTSISKENKSVNKANKNTVNKLINNKSLESSVVENIAIDKESLEKTFNEKNSEDSKLVESIAATTENETDFTAEEKPAGQSEKKEDEETKEDEKLPAIEEAIAQQEKKEELTEEEKEKEEELLNNKWQIRPNIAPVYYNSLSSGSPIDEQFKGNKKKGEVNMSYGLNVSYKLNKKLKVRAGVNKLELGYSTENVAIVPVADNSSLDFIKNVSVVSNAQHINVASADGFSVSQIPSSFQTLFDSKINQKFGYIEVPLELSYQVSSKKVSIDLIAGMSTFFLNKNEVHAQTNSFTTYLGEANNLNKMSFSTNLGVGFNYKISKAFRLNVEPTFKYQLNSFSNDAGNFKPYILGVYSGLSFKF